MPVEGLSAYVTFHPEITKDEFNSFALRIMERQGGIHSIEIVKGTVITDYIYLLEGNETAIGLDLMSMPPEREAIRRAIETKKTVVAGPDYSLRYNIYRICQEALNNAVKHSGADKVEIKLSLSGKKLYMEIKDNGKGFDYEGIKGENGWSGLSMIGERAGLLKGSWNIQTIPGEGTSIQLTAPVA